MQAYDLLSIDTDELAEERFAGDITESGEHLPKNAKLTDEEVVSMRELRANYGIDWDMLAEMFHANWKTCYRICMGMSRPNVPGPLEPRQIVPEIEVTVRCGACGGKHAAGKMCVLCQCRWSAYIVRFLAKGRIIRARDF